MKKFIFLILTASIIILSGCGKENLTSNIPQNNYNPFSNYETANNEQVDAMFGFGLVEPAINGEIRYSDNMSLDFWIENAGQDGNFGFMLFVDGIRQKYSLNESNEKTDMHIFNIKKGEKNIFTLNFEPVADKYDETLDFSYVVVNNPEFIPESPITIFGNNYRITPINLKMIDVAKEINLENDSIDISSSKISNEEKQSFIEYDESGNITGNRLDKNPQIVLLKNEITSQENDPTPNFVCPSDKVKVELKGGDERHWRLSMYIDHQLVPAFNGYNYANMIASSDKKSTYTIDLSKLSVPVNKYSSIYFLAVPVEKSKDTILQSTVIVYGSR